MNLIARYRAEHPHVWVQGGYYCPTRGTYFVTVLRNGDEFCGGCDARVRYPELHVRLPMDRGERDVR